MLRDYRILYKYTLKETMDYFVTVLNHPWKTAIAAIIFTTVFFLRKLRPSSKKSNLPDYEDGVAYLHTFPRNFTKKVINLSPYAIKVETWCRMNNVPYKLVETTKFSSKEGQIPWMILNGKEYADSSVIINVLKDRFNITSDDDLSEENKGVERTASRMLDDSFACLYFYHRYFSHQKEFAKYFKVTSAPLFLQSFIHKQIGRNVKKRAYFMGFIRYGDKHMQDIGNKDLKSLEQILGNNEYFFGERPSTLDATVFGHLTQVLYPDMPYPWKQYLLDECPKLCEFCERIKVKYWPEWDSLVEDDTFDSCN